MRGRKDPQTTMLSLVAPEQRVPKAHPLRRIKELAEEDRRAAERPGLDGTDVMDHLGLTPGPDVGRALAYLLQVKRSEGDLPRDELLTRLEAWWAERRSQR